jgi:hypothetical protein
MGGFLPLGLSLLLLAASAATPAAQCNDRGILGAKWCGRPTVFYHFGPGLSGSCAPTTECFRWRTAIRNAVTEWNGVTTFFEESFFLQEGDFSDVPVPGGILFTLSDSPDLGFQDANCQQTGPPDPPRVCNGETAAGQAYGAYTSLLVSAPVGSATMSTIIAACVNINPLWQWGQVDRQSVARHEIGHALGIGHAYGGDCLM